MNKTDHMTTVFLYQLWNAGIFSCAILFCFSDFCGISRVDVKHITVLLLTIILFGAVRLLSRRQQMYAAIMGIFLLYSFYREVLSEEKLSIQLVRVFLLAVIGFFLQLLVQKNRILKVILSAVAGGWLLYALFWNREVPKMGVILLIIYIISGAAEWIRAGWQKMKNKNAQAFTLGVLPFLIIYLLLLSIMPIRKEAYDWQWVKNIYRSAGEKISMFSENLWHTGNEYFDGAVSGFSEDGVLFPGITRVDRQLMMLEIRNHKNMPVYLAGKVFDTFNGREWSSQGKSSESERIFDVLETVYALEGYAENDKLNYYRDVQMEIKYQYFHTGYLMAPTKAWKIEGEKIKYHSDGTDLIFDSKAGYGTEYVFRFCQLNMEREELYHFLTWDKKEDGSAWEKVVRQYSEDKLAMDELYVYRQKMKEIYLPETSVSPEVEAWLLSVTADAKTDVEKLKYIEDALAGMAYNTNPGKLPERVTDEKSFLDYFLLEKREGYCAYFATAFVLLARAEGFPARYVQGFCIPTVSGEGTFVYSHMAHSWPEVYIEGKGWIAFEPTPGYGVNRYTPWEKAVYPHSKADKVQEEVAAEEVHFVEEVPEEKEQSRWLSYFVRVILILMAGGVLAFVIDLMIITRKEKRRELDEKYRLAVLHNLQILGMLGYKREPSETYQELTERIRRNTSGGDEISLGFIEIYENVLYGMLKIDEQIWKGVLEEREELLAALKMSKGKKYLFYRFRLYFAKMIQK